MCVYIRGDMGDWIMRFNDLTIGSTKQNSPVFNTSLIIVSSPAALPFLSFLITFMTSLLVTTLLIIKLMASVS